MRCEYLWIIKTTIGINNKDIVKKLFIRGINVNNKKKKSNIDKISRNLLEGIENKCRDGPALKGADFEKNVAAIITKGGINIAYRLSH